MKKAPHKTIFLLALSGVVVLMSGCASNNCSTGLNGWNPFKNRPVRTTVKSWFRGDSCSTCNPPAGQVLNYGNASAPCNCGNAANFSGTIDPGVPLYGNPNLTAPAGTPIFDPAMQNPAPIYNETSSIQTGPAVGEIEAAYGTGVEGILPPQF